MNGYVADIEKLTEENADFRRVLYSGDKLQLVLMSIRPGEEIGGEVHADTDQFFRIEAGKGRVLIEGVTHKIKAGDGIVVPAGAHHNVICTGHDPLKLYTIYGPSTGRCDASTVRMISSFSEAGYLLRRRPHPRRCFF